MTRSSRIIHSALGVVCSALGYGAGFVAVGYVLAREAVRNVREAVAYAGNLVRSEEHEAEVEQMPQQVALVFVNEDAIDLELPTMGAAVDESQRWN